MPNHRLPALALSLLGVFGPRLALAQAESGEQSKLEAHYFGTAAYSGSNNADLMPRANLRQGFGASPEGTFGVDSKTGVQLDYHPNDKLTLTGMAYCEEAMKNSCPKLLWAYLKWDISEDYALKAGRFRLAPFLGSEAQEVGYLSSWARNPIELYNTYPSDDINGAQLEKAWSAGSGEIRVSGVAGNQSGNIANAGNYSVNIAAAKLRGSWPSFDWVLAATRYKFNYDIGPDLTGLNQNATLIGYPDLADAYSSPASGWLCSAGGHWGPEKSPWFAQAELGYRTSDKLFANTLVSGYLMGGLRQGPISLFASRGFARNLTPTQESRGGPLNSYYQQALNQATWDHSSWIVGGRYEINKNWDAKFQMGWHKSSGGNDATVFSPSGPSAPASSFREAVISLDFLF